MPARKTPSRGGKPDKLIANALMLELKRETLDCDGKPSIKLREMAAKMVDLAVGGDVQAFKLIADRVDGKVPTVIGTAKDDDARMDPIRAFAVLVDEVAVEAPSLADQVAATAQAQGAIGLPAPANDHGNGHDPEDEGGAQSNGAA